MAAHHVRVVLDRELALRIGNASLGLCHPAHEVLRIAAGVPEPEAGVGPLETVGDGLALNTTFEAAAAGIMGTLGTGAARAIGGRPDAAPMLARAGLVFIIPASFAAISARFCATSSAGDSWKHGESAEELNGEAHTPVMEVEGALEFEVF